MIMCLLTSFGIMEKALGTELTPTAAAVLFELYQPINNGSKYVKASEIVFRQKVPKVLYRRPGSTFIPLTAYVPGCGAQENCPIDNFTSCCDSYTSSNPKGECVSHVLSGEKDKCSELSLFFPCLFFVSCSSTLIIHPLLIT